MKPHSLGIIQIILSGFMFSFIGLIGKIAFERGIGSMELLGFRFVFSSLIIFLFMMLFNRSLLKTSLKNILLFAALGVGGYSMMAITFFFALESISASLCVLLLYTYPIMVALIGHFFLKEKKSMIECFFLSDPIYYSILFLFYYTYLSNVKIFLAKSVIFCTIDYVCLYPIDLRFYRI